MTDVLDWLDAMRAALARCTFLPASSDKRFARQVSQMYLDKISERQRRHVIRLCWKYRRQMPHRLVPSKDAVEAMDKGWQAVEVAGMSVHTTPPRPAKEPKRPKVSKHPTIWNDPRQIGLAL